MASPHTLVKGQVTGCQYTIGACYLPDSVSVTTTLELGAWSVLYQKKRNRVRPALLRGLASRHSHMDNGRLPGNHM